MSNPLEEVHTGAPAEGVQKPGEHLVRPREDAPTASEVGAEAAKTSAAVAGIRERLKESAVRETAVATEEVPAENYSPAEKKIISLLRRFMPFHEIGDEGFKETFEYAMERKKDSNSGTELGAGAVGSATFGIGAFGVAPAMFTAGLAGWPLVLTIGAIAAAGGITFWGIVKLKHVAGDMMLREKAKKLIR